jgi:Zn ribbon nucleic-acid-binding protein
METPIEAGSLDLWVIPAVHIYAPPATHRFVLAKTCPDCGKRTRMLGWSYEWHGASLTCLRCGREWQGGEWMPLPFIRGAMAHNIAEAKARWRRDSWHNAIVSGAGRRPLE